MRRRLLPMAAVLAALAFGVLVAATVGEPSDRLARAIADMERLPGVHFDMQATVRADSPISEQQPAGGTLRQDVRAYGDIVFPDRLHLVTAVGPEGEGPRELIVVGERAWAKIAGEWRRVAGGTASTDPRAALDILKGPGVARFRGYWLNGGTITYHVQIELDADALAERQRRRGDALASQLNGTGRIEVFIGLFDGRIRRQEVEIIERSGGELAPGSGLYRIRTEYAIDYSGFDQRVEIREPR